MDLKGLYSKIEEFSKEKHGSSDLFKEEYFVLGEQIDEVDCFAPLKFLQKKLELPNLLKDLFRSGFICESYDLQGLRSFEQWYETQFGRKLKRTLAKNIRIVQMPNNKKIFDAIEMVNNAYSVLRDESILLNGKNLPVQLGEWYAKCIFGLEQKKSTSQRGFDFFLDGNRVEIKVHWSDFSSPKGVKLKKSLVSLSKHCVIMYIARNFTIREICFLDSDFVNRKFSGKGHTLFLKDSDVSQYFFSNSTKQLVNVANKSALLRYSTPKLAMNLEEKL